MQNIAHDDQFHRHKSKSPSNKNSNVLNFQRFIKNIGNIIIHLLVIYLYILL